MSDNSLTKFGQPLRIEFGPSRRLAQAAAVIHVLAAVACLPATLPLLLRLLLAVASAAHFVWFLRRQASAKTGAAIRAIAWDSARGWRVRCPGADWQTARLLVPVFVSASLVVMRFRPAAGRTCSAIVVADRLPADDFRRLRLRLLQSTRVDGTE
jgi:hypothetical protein